MTTEEESKLDQLSFAKMLCGGLCQLADMHDEFMEKELSGEVTSEQLKSVIGLLIRKRVLYREAKDGSRAIAEYYNKMPGSDDDWEENIKLYSRGAERLGEAIEIVQKRLEELTDQLQDKIKQENTQ